jgi:hypothetical protein
MEYSLLHKHGKWFLKSSQENISEDSLEKFLEVVVGKISERHLEYIKTSSEETFGLFLETIEEYIPKPRARKF